MTLVKGLKQKFLCYWPELDMYYGCCSLQTGIYIRTALGFFTNVLSIVVNGIMIYYLLDMKHSVSTYIGCSLDLERYNEFQIREKEVSRIILITFIVTWMALKAFHIFLGLFMMYAIYKKKPTALKCYLYFCVPFWIVDVFISAIGFMFINTLVKIVFMICLLTEGYNLLAVNSQYKQLSGKSGLVPNEEIEPSYPIPETHVHPPQLGILNLNPLNSLPHCSTCSCFCVTPTSNINNNTASSPRSLMQQIPVQEPNIEDSNENSPKEPNIKDTPIIFDQNQFIRNNNPVVVEAGASRGNNEPVIRPNSLAIKNKQDMDNPVIYDPNQLNVGTSPLIQDRLLPDNCFASKVL